MRKLLALVLFSLLSVSVFASLPTQTLVWEIRTTGSDTNGGGFNTGASGSDMSLFNQANGAACTTAGTTCYSKTVDISTTDSVATGTTSITSATGNFDAAIVGNVIYLTGGTGSLTAGWYYVSVRTNATTITVDRTVPAGTGITMNIGGALLSPGAAGALMAVAGHTAYIQNVGADGASVYSITSASTNVAGGIPLPAGGGAVFQGYTSSRTLGNTDARPTWQLNVSSATMIPSTITYQNIIFDGNSQTSAKYISTTAYQYRIVAKNFNTASTAGGYCYSCLFTANSAVVFAGLTCIDCEAYANTATPFTNTVCVECISSFNTGATTHGFAVGVICYHCDGVSNGQDGINILGTGGGFIIDSTMESNARYGYDLGIGKTLINNSYFGNTTAGIFSSTNLETIVGSINTSGGSVFVAPGSNNYALNSTVGQGALLQNTADPANFPRGLTANYRDIGSAQHQAGVGGGQTGYIY